MTGQRSALRSSPLLVAVLLALPGAVATPALAASGAYVRGALGYEESGSTTVADLDCTSTAPPALFGCVQGGDGRPIGARGDFGEGAAVDLALGLEVGRRTRIELALTSRPGLELEAEANFLGVAGEQPVHAGAESLAAMLVVALDLGRPGWRLQPFVAGGAGAARNEADDVTYAFPGIAPDAVTVVQGGDHSDFAWAAAAGASFRLTAAASLELAYRYADLGEVRTDAGEATIVRSRGTFRLEVAATRAELDTAGVTVGLRYRL